MESNLHSLGSQLHPEQTSNRESGTPYWSAGSQSLNASLDNGFFEDLVICSSSNSAWCLIWVVNGGSNLKAPSNLDKREGRLPKLLCWKHNLYLYFVFIWVGLEELIEIRGLNLLSHPPQYMVVKERIASLDYNLLEVSDLPFSISTVWEYCLRYSSPHCLWNWSELSSLPFSCYSLFLECPFLSLPWKLFTNHWNLIQVNSSLRTLNTPHPMPKAR